MFSEETIKVLNALSIKLQLTEQVTREGVLEWLRLLLIEQNADKILTTEESIQLLSVTQNECHVGTMTSKVVSHQQFRGA